MSGIGVLNEKPLHAALKQAYAQPGDRFEVRVERYVVDILQADRLVEIQTGGFSSIKTKLSELARTHRVTLVYPVAVEKWIVKMVEHEAGQNIRRKSPRRGRVEDIFGELVSFPHLLKDPNFSLEVLFIKEEQLRHYDGKRAFRRRGWVIGERRLLEVTGRRTFEQPADWLALLPESLKEPFTAADLSVELGISRRLAGKMVYCLHKPGFILPAGKRGRASLYRLDNREFKALENEIKISWSEKESPQKR